MSDSPDYSIVIIFVLLIVIGYLFLNRNPPPPTYYPPSQAKPSKSVEKEKSDADDSFFEVEDQKIKESKKLKPWECCLNLPGYEHSCVTACPHSYRYVQGGSIATGESIEEWGYGCTSMNKCTEEEQKAGKCW